MIDNFDARFDAAYQRQLYRRFCTESDHTAYAERYLVNPADEGTDIEQESIEVYNTLEPF